MAIKETVEILIRLLAQGEIIQLTSKDSLGMDENGKIGWVMEKDGEQILLLDNGISFNYLVDIAEKIGHAELWLRACALNFP